MLALRLSEGLVFDNFKKRFDKSVPDNIIKKARELEKHGLVKVDGNSISLTVQGFLISNSIISELI